MTSIGKITENKKKYHNAYETNSGIIVTAEWNAGSWVNQLDALENKQYEFEMQLAHYRQQCDAAEQGFDNVPVAAFDFGRAAWLMALAYGCPMVKINGLINAEALYRSIEETEKFQKIDRIWEYGLYPVITERIEEFQKRYGDVPITISDNQSPNDVLTSILCSEEAMVAMFTEKEAIHRMLGIITESVIEINRYFEKTIKNFGGFQCAKYLPFGMHISDDNAAFLSPDTYKEFSKQYNERLAEKFGGIAFHCCMGHEQNLSNMASTKGYLGFDAMPDYNSIDKVIDSIEGRGVWNVYNFSYAVSPERQQVTSDEEWFRNIIDMSEGKCGLVLNVYSESRDDALRLAEKIKNYSER